MPIKVAAFYCFAEVADPSALRKALLAKAETLDLCGSTLVAAEGINGTMAGHPAAIDEWAAHLRALPGCANIDIKFSGAVERPFLRLKVRLKKEIVTMGVPECDPVKDVGTYLDPAEWNALIADPDTIVIDTRNDYEVEIGTFERAIDPATHSFREFPAWFDAFADNLRETGKQPKIAMFCTGGIRCEKATAYVREQGFDEVFHLKGGILRYLEETPPEQSRWNGSCFVFDSRVAVGHGLALSDYGLCHACRRPVSPEERASPLYLEGVQCPHCHDERDEEQRARYRARQEQIERLGSTHLGDAARSRQNG